MAISKDEVLDELAASFNTVEELQGFLTIAKPALSVVKLTNELTAMKADLETSQTALEQEILAKQAEFDAVILQMRSDKATDLEQRKTAIANKQAEIDALNAQIN